MELCCFTRFIREYRRNIGVDMEMSFNRTHISSQKEPSVGSTKISVLNNDCLMHIFQYLTIIDRIRLERVCKRWQLVSKESWHDMKKLTFENNYWGFKKPANSKKITIRMLKKVLNRCGQYITNLQFGESQKRLGPMVLATIAKYCPNLRIIDASEITVSPHSICLLASGCKNLSSFALGDCSDECDLELSLLFRQNQGLKYLRFYENFEITGECLNDLNFFSIQSIVFENCPYVMLTYFSFVKCCPNLKTLVIEHFHDLDVDAMVDIGSCCTNLSDLTLACCPFYSISIMHVSGLKNLVRLDVSSNVSVDDNFLVAIGSNCKLLSIIDISYCHLVTNAGLISIVALPYLTVLLMENLDNVDDGVFTSMPYLKTIDCSFCSNMQDAGLARLIKSSQNIEDIHLVNCKKITNGLIEAAIYHTWKRKNGIILKLHVGFTNIIRSKVNGWSPFLSILPSITVQLCS